MNTNKLPPQRTGPWDAQPAAAAIPAGGSLASRSRPTVSRRRHPKRGVHSHVTLAPGSVTGVTPHDEAIAGSGSQQLLFVDMCSQRDELDASQRPHTSPDEADGSTPPPEAPRTPS